MIHMRSPLKLAVAATCSALPRAACYAPLPRQLAATRCSGWVPQSTIALLRRPFASSSPAAAAQSMQTSTARRSSEGAEGGGERPRKTKVLKRDRPRVVAATGRLLRLERLLANRGLGTRTEVAKIIKQGRIRVNGEVVRSGSARYSDTVRLTYDGREVECLPLLVAFYKPKGIVSTLSDDWDRKDLKVSMHFAAAQFVVI
jgi:S4 domain